MQMTDITRRSFMNRSMAGVMGATFGTFALDALCEENGASGIAGVSSPKNIICFLCDDISASELGCYGNTSHKTPYLDALAATGTRFETFYATPVCSPTRVCLLTGRYGFRTGWCNMRGRSAGGPPPDADLARDEVNFAQILLKHGYATGFAGKWQLTGDSLETMLSDAGFQESLIWIYTGYLNKGEKYLGGYYPPGAKKSSRYWHPGLAHNGAHFATTAQDYGPNKFADFSVDFIRKHREGPFLLYYPMALVHKPWLPTPDTPDLQGENRPAHFKANVEYADKIVGRLVNELDSLGIRENTVVMFIGDNGTQGAGKSSPTEYGARVPCILNCPGTIRSGVVSRELSDIADILPTMLDFAGLPKPEGVDLDGTSLAPYLRGETDSHRDMIFSCLGHYRILRDRHWLLEQNTEDRFGQFFYCGENRNGAGYVDVTHSEEPEARNARERFLAQLTRLPVPKTTPEARLEFQAQTESKIKTLNRYLQAVDKSLPQRVVPPLPQGYNAPTAPPDDEES